MAQPPVQRPTFASDIHPGMRIVAASQLGLFGPATVLPDGLTELVGGLVAVKAMADDGQVVVLTLPSWQTVMELVEVPPLTEACDCGTPDCPGAWPTLDHDPHPLYARGQLTGTRPLFGITASRSILDTFLAPTRDCSGEDCCPTRGDDPDDDDGKPDECASGPEAHGGYL
jgi:hypothetical protein